MTLRLPSFPETLGAQEFPLDLNRMEVHGEPMAHLLGSWAADLPNGSEPTPFFTCFAPNVTLRPGAAQPGARHGCASEVDRVAIA